MDLTYLLILQNIREALGGIFDAYMLKVTSFAEAVPTFLLLAGIYWCVDKRTGQCMGWNIALACTWSQFLKAVCKIDRPWVRDARIHPVEAAIPAASGYSFPSGHTARAVAAWGTAGSCAWKKGKTGADRYGKCLGALLWILTALILFSRNYLGVHTPQDVAVALLLGLGWIWAVGKLLGWVDRHPNGDLFACGAGCLLCFLPMLRVGCISNAGAGMGLLMGWLTERRMVRFQTAGSVQRRCVRFLIGGGLALFLLEVVNPALALVIAGKYAGFFSMFLFTFFVMAGYPYLFSRFEAQDTPEGKQKHLKYGAGIFAALLLALLVFSAVSVRQKQAEQGASADGSTAEADGVQEEMRPGMADGAQEEMGSGLEGVIQNGLEAKLQIIAHRGYSSVFPENTLAAFTAALELGVDMIETDVQMTKDGQIVIFHDNELRRITGCEGTVADYTYEELSAMDAGKWFSDSYAGERIPTLRQMLELVRDSDVDIYLELKDIGETEGFVEAVYAVTKETGMTERCMFASFRYEYLAQLKEMNPDVCVLYNTLSAKSSLPQEYPADCYGLSSETANVEVIAAIHATSGRAFVWTVDTPQQMKNLQEMGADGIVTNRPGLAKVMARPEYAFVADHFERSVTVPGLYGEGMEMLGWLIMTGTGLLRF